jgi:WD40 repeat protein/anaphase-promoting complex subunit 3
VKFNSLKKIISHSIKFLLPKNMSKFLNTFLLSLIFVLVFVSVNAQTSRSTRKPPPLSKDQAKDVSRQAEGLFDDEMYKKAIPLYIRLVDYDKMNAEYNYNLGYSYLHSNVDKKEAYKYLATAADKKDAPKDVMFRLGQALLVAGLYDEAIDAFDRYKTQNEGKKANANLDVELNLGWCNNAKKIIKSPIGVSFRNLGKSVNSKYPEYSPVAMAVDTIVYFTSNRQGNMGGVVDGYGEIVSDAYYSTRTDTVWYRAKNLGYNVNFEGYDICTGVNSNGNKMLIYKEGGGISGDIYISSQKYKTWQKAELFDEDFDTRELETGACMSPDGKTIYFASDRKGTLGGKDIFMRYIDSTKTWSDAINLGPEINTPYDEESPFIWHDGKTLFFASQGHNSMGGFDIFKTTTPDKSAKWATPENIGYPLNTSDDNKYFTLCADGKNGFVSASMAGGYGDLDIWHFVVDEPLVTGNSVLFRGRINASNGLPAKNSICKITKTSTGELMGILGVTGRASEFFILLPPGTYELMARDPRAGNLQAKVTITGNEKDGVVAKTFTLKPRGRR